MSPNCLDWDISDTQDINCPVAVEGYEIENSDFRCKSIPKPFRYLYPSLVRTGDSSEASIYYTSVILEEDVPVGTSEDILSEQEWVKEFICELPKLLKAHFARTLIERISYLFDESLEDDEMTTMSLVSLRNFIHFINNTTDIKAPDIVLSVDGEIVAEWAKSNQGIFRVKFLTDEKICFYLKKCTQQIIYGKILNTDLESFMKNNRIDDLAFQK